MCIAALFTTAEAWKQIMTDERIKMWYTYTMDYHSAIEKNEVTPFAATCVDLEIIILSEVNGKENDKYHMMSLICGISSTIRVNISMKQTQRHKEQTCSC